MLKQAITRLLQLIKPVFTLSYLKFFIKNKFLRLLAVFFVLIIYYVIALHVNFLWLFGYMPNASEVRDPQVAIASEVYTADSVLIGKFYNENRTPVPFSEISPNVIKALIATEDVRFYKHHGMDLFALAGGVYSTAKGDDRGASTITQQLAKNMFSTRKKINQGLLQYIPFIRTVVSKTKEWVTALKLELFYSKNEILEMYLNTVDYGNNWFGIKVASKNYFNKPPADLNVEEAATLIGLLKATSSYNPIRNKKSAKLRRNVVLSQLLKYNELTQQQYDSISQLPIALKSRKNNTDEKDSYLRQFVERSLKVWCEENKVNLYEDGIKIYTTINSHLQRYAEQATHEHMKKMQKMFYEHWGRQNPWVDENGNELKRFIEISMTFTPVYEHLKRKYDGNKDSINIALNQKKRMKVFTYDGSKDTTFSSFDSLRYYAKILNAGMMSLDPVSGEIRAYVGGVDYNFFKYDHVTQAKRQAGSTFKPFAYLAALADTFTPCSRFVDQPVRIEYEGGQVWEPKNSDGVFTYHSKTLRRAMAQSCNSVTAQLTETVGWDKVVEYAHKAGITSRLDTVPSICLGSSDVSVFEMARAYGTFVNKGERTDPIIVKRICNSNNELMETFSAHQEPVIEEETAWLMLYMLLGGIQEPGGTSQALWGYDIFGNGNEVGGKTGTTSNYSDAWYMGVTHDLVTGVWVGADYRSVHFRHSTGQGSRAALPIFAKMLEKAYKDPKSGITQARFPKPGVKIKKEYYCMYDEDSLVLDSLLNDTTLVPINTDSLKPVDSLNNHLVEPAD